MVIVLLWITDNEFTPLISYVQPSVTGSTTESRLGLQTSVNIG